LDGKILVDGKPGPVLRIQKKHLPTPMWASSIQPFWIEGEARKLPGTNFIVSGRFKVHTVLDRNLIRGQRQFAPSGVLV
jgi:hypothetical protein